MFAQGLARLFNHDEARRVIGLVGDADMGLQTTRFSAKEAFSKAIGLGMRLPMTWRDCEIVKGANGKPQIRLHGALAAWFEARSLLAHVSVTDETDYAASFVVVETKDGT